MAARATTICPGPRSFLLRLHFIMLCPDDATAIAFEREPGALLHDQAGAPFHL